MIGIHRNLVKTFGMKNSTSTFFRIGKSTITKEKPASGADSREVYEPFNS